MTWTSTLGCSTIDYYLVRLLNINKTNKPMAVRLSRLLRAATHTKAPADQPFFDSVVRRVGAKVARRAAPAPLAAVM